MISLPTWHLLVQRAIWPMAVSHANFDSNRETSSLHEQQWSHSQPDICWYNEQFDPWLWAMQILTATGKLDCQPVNAALVTGSSSLLQLYDKNSRLHFLIATGAAISMFLAGLLHRFQKSDVTLQAENNSIKHQQFLTVNPWIWAPTSPHLAISRNWCNLTYHWHWFSVATQIVNGSGQTTPNWH